MHLDYWPISGADLFVGGLCYGLGLLVIIDRHEVLHGHFGIVIRIVSMACDCIGWVALLIGNLRGWRCSGSWFYRLTITDGR